MKFSSEQRRQFKKALISAFPNQGDLEQMIDGYFDLNLQTIAIGANYSDVVFKLIKWAEAHGRLKELITYARVDNPGNPDLLAFVGQIQGMPVDINAANQVPDLQQNGSVKKYMSAVSQLKQLHHMFHKLEAALSAFEMLMHGNLSRKESPDFNFIRVSWRITVLPQIIDITTFSEKNKQSLAETSLTETEKWIVGLLQVKNDFEASWNEHNASAIYELSQSILDDCREHLYRIDQQLLEEITGVLAT